MCLEDEGATDDILKQLEEKPLGEDGTVPLAVLSKMEANDEYGTHCYHMTTNFYFLSPLPLQIVILSRPRH